MMRRGARLLGAASALAFALALPARADHMGGDYEAIDYIANRPSDDYQTNFPSDDYYNNYPSDDYSNNFPSDDYSNNFPSDDYSNNFPSDDYSNNYPGESGGQPAAAACEHDLPHGLKESVLYRAADGTKMFAVSTHERQRCVCARSAYRTRMHACILGASFRATVSCSNTRLTRSAPPPPPPHTHARTHRTHAHTHTRTPHTHTPFASKKKKKRPARVRCAHDRRARGERHRGGRARAHGQGGGGARGARRCARAALGWLRGQVVVGRSRACARALARASARTCRQTRGHCSGGRQLTDATRPHRLACATRSCRREARARAPAAGTWCPATAAALSSASHTTTAVTTTARTAAPTRCESAHARAPACSRVGPSPTHLDPHPHTLPRVRALCTHPRPHTVR